MEEIRKFRPKARLISTIGSEIIKDNYAAIIELVKNSYDADANRVDISFCFLNDTFVIKICDDGIGMSKETIFNKWLVPATDDKLINKISTKGRKVQGRKGIGRFSAGVLGDKLTMTSIHNKKESIVNINWLDFQGAKFLDEIDVVIEENESKKNNGTEFVIYPTEKQIKEWTDKAFGDLIKELNKTITPILKETPKFKIYLHIDKNISFKYCGEIEIKPFAILDLYNYSAVGNVVGQTINFKYENKYENITDEVNIELGDKLVNICGNINFEFRAFDRDPSVIKSLTKNDMFKTMDGTKMSESEIREMLNDICGVFIYRNDFRVRPYGDIDFDWLNLDKERVQNPSVKLGANQLFGIIKIEDEEKSNLIDKSARDGLKQNESYAVFKKIILFIIREIENKRYSYRKNTGKGRNVKTSGNYIILDNISKLSSHKEIASNVSIILENENISEKAKTNIKDTFDKYEKESEKLAKDIQEQIAMYQGQATLGKIMDVIMHEVKKPLSWFNNNADDMPVYYSEYKSTGNLDWINKILEKSITAAEQSSEIVTLFKRLDPLATKTRKTCQNIKIAKLIEDVLEIFKKIIKKYDIKINVFCDEAVTYFGWKSDLMMCLTNIIENSIYWLLRFNSAIVADGGTADGVMGLEIIANRPLALGTTVGGGEGVTVIPEGEALLAVYIRDGSLYIDVTALEVLGLSLPVFKADNFDLPSFLYGKIDELVSGIFAEENTEGEGGTSVADALALADGDGGNVTLILARNRLQLSVTMAAIGALLSNFLTGDAATTVEDILSSLGDVSVDLSLLRDDTAGNGVYNFTLSAGGNIMTTVDGQPSAFALSVGASSADIKLGDDTLYETFGAYVDGKIAGYDKTYSDILRGIADNLFKGSMLIDVEVDLNTGKYYLNELVNNILSAVTDGSEIVVPIAVETGTFGKALQLALQWNLDPDSKQLKLMFEVRDGGNVLIGAYMYDGELVIDLTGVGLISVKVSDVAVIDQLTDSLMTAIDSLQGLDLNELLGGLFGDDQTTMSLTPRDGSESGDTGSAGDADAADNAWIAQLLGVVMLENTNIKLALSTEILENVIFALAGKRIDLGDLFDLSANLGILSGVISFDAKLFGDDENALISMSVDASLSNDTIVSNAYIQAVFMRDHYEINASDTGTIITDAINNFADVSFALDLALSFQKGSYNIAELISKFGVSALAGTQLLWEFTEDTTISLTLEIKLKLYADDGTDGGKNGMASIEFKTKDAFKLGVSQLFPADTVLIGLYAYEDVLYLDAGGISILGIDLPVFKVDFDLFGTLMTKLREMGNSAQTQSEPVIVASDETGEGNDTVLMPLDDSDGEISIGITENEIAVTAALGAIAAVLEDLGVNLGVDLGAFDITAAIRIKDGLSVEVGGVLVPSTDGSEKPFLLSLTIPGDALQFGVDVNALGNYLKQKANAYKDYNDDLIATLKETLGNNSIKADVTIESQASKVDMNTLIAGILKTAGIDLNIPVNLYFDEMNYELELLLNWDMASRKLLLEVNIKGKINKKTLIGLYGDSSDLYIALGGVGLVDLHVKGSPLVPVLFNKLDEALAGINPIIISDILEDLFAGKDLSEESANMNSGETQPLDGENASTLAGGNDLIRYLLSSLKITDSKVVADITSDIMAQIMRALGIDIDFVFEAGVGVDLAGDKIEGYVNIGSDSQIGLVLGLNGKPTRFLPSDLSTYITIDAENGAQDGGQVVKEFIDGFDFAFSLDLMSATVGTLVDSSRGVTYTRVEIKKVTGVVALDNHSMTAGAAGKSGILLSVLSVSEEEYNSHGSGTTKAMMHVYLDYSAGSATLYLCPGWFEIKVILGIPVDITTYLKSMTLQLDLLNMLAPTVENLIKQVNDAANNLGNEETPEETPPSQDTGSGEETEPTGIAKVIADLDIEALLRPGIDLNLLSTGVTNLNVKFDPYELNKLIDGIMGCLFGADTILDLTTVEAKGAKLFSQNYLQRMWWDRLAGSNTASAAEGKTPYSTWDSIQKDLRNIINDVLPAVGYGNISWLLGAIDWSGTTGNFHEIFKRITSIAVFNEAEINVNLLEGTLANISFIGSDTGAAVTKYELGSDGVWRDTGEILTHRVRSTYAISSKRDTDGAYYYTYKYAGSGPAAEYGGRGLLFRSGYAYYSEKGIDATYGYEDGDYNKNYSQIYYSNEIWIYNKSSTVGDPNYTLNGTEGAVDWGNLSANVTFNPYMYSSENQYQAAVDEYWDRYFSDYGTAVYQKGTAVKRGTISLSYNGRAFDKSVLKEIMNRAGTHTIRATATFKDGTSSWTDLTFRVKDVGTGGQDSVRSVDTVNLHVYESVPDYFTVTTYSGERVKYYTDGKTVTLEGDYKATSPAGGTKTARLKFANGASYPVTINYYDSTINDQTIDMSWYDLDFTGADTAEGKDAAVQAILDKFDMYYGDGTFIPELLTENATWDTTELYGLVARDRGNLSATTVNVTVTFDKRIGTDGTTLENVESALRQTVTLTLNLEDKRKLSVVYAGMTEGNYLKVDPYRYYLYMVTGNESDNPIPSTVTATYQGGKKETVNVVTQFAADTDWSYMTAKTVTATVKIDPTKYDGKGYFDENMQISVNIDRNVIQAVYFDDAKTQDYIVRGEKYAVATVVFTNGLELKMPVAVVENGNEADVYIGFDVETYTTYGKIATFSGINGTLLQAFTVEIR